MAFSPLAVADLRIVFVGARIVGHRVLEALLQAGANVVGLLTLDESKQESTSAFTLFTCLCTEYRLNVRKFTSLKDPALNDWLRELHPDLGMVVGVSQLISADLLAIPPRGFIGMHPTLLPEGRGRAPIPWALIKGLEKTGSSLFYCDPAADSGDLLAQQQVPIYYEDDSSTLGSRTDDAAVALFLQALPQLAAGTAPRTAQDDRRATHWPQRRPEDGIIDWRKTSRQLYDWVRALTRPYPGAFTFLAGRKLFVWSAAEAPAGRGEPGEILAVGPQGVLVATGAGALLLTRVGGEMGEDVDVESAGLVVGQRFSADDQKGSP